MRVGSGSRRHQVGNARSRKGATVLSYSEQDREILKSAFELAIRRAQAIHDPTLSA
jgi:hypothetical protein